MVNEPEFHPASTRIAGERADRLKLAALRLPYRHSFLDDLLRGIGKHDLVLLGAETGAGKTDFATGIAKANARAGKRVFYFALEAEPNEIERRAKYAFITELAARAQDPRADELSYPDWIAGRSEDVTEKFDAEADRLMAQHLRTLHTYYRGRKFDIAEIERLFTSIQNQADLVVIDHLHYVDTDDANENRGYKHIVQTIRTAALEIGVPVILVAHLRKRDMRAKQLVPHVEDFHGSSELIKNSTHCIQLAPARCIEPAKWWLAPTFIHVPKDRVGGYSGFVALCNYHRMLRRYEQHYTLGRLTEGGTEWEPIKPGDVPRWARNHRALQS